MSRARRGSECPERYSSCQAANGQLSEPIGHRTKRLASDRIGLILKVTTLDAACGRSAANATPGCDQQSWSNMAQDYDDMAGTLRVAVLIDNLDMTEIAA